MFIFSYRPIRDKINPKWTGSKPNLSGDRKKDRREFILRISSAIEDGLCSIAARLFRIAKPGF